MQDPREIALGAERPVVDPSAWLAPRAMVVGNVKIGAEVGVYYNAVLRAEGASIEVGARSNIQDNCSLHAGLVHDLRIGSGVTVGHNAVVHGCTVEDDVLIGMGAILLNDCVIGQGSMIGAGTLVGEGVVIPPGSLVLGSPGRVVRTLSAAEQDQLRAGADHYVGLLDLHRQATTRGR